MNLKRRQARGTGPSLFLSLGLGSLVLASLALAVAAIAADVKVPKLDLRDTKLENGLRVILVPDHSAPVYAIDVAYNVGSRNETPGHTGFAHLFEHMMFQGSENVGKGEHFVLVLNNGGNMNGTTTEDRTTYFEELPKNQLDLGLFLESDRMRALNITQANLDNQRNAVQEERRQGIDNQPYGRAELDIDSLVLRQLRVQAFDHRIDGRSQRCAPIDDVKDFFRIYYAPNNAVLTLVGDFDPDDALARVKKYFGSIPSQPAPPKVDLAEETHYGERSETIYDPLARLAANLYRLSYPAGQHAGELTRRVQLAMILGEGQSSRLYQHLVKDKQLPRRSPFEPDSRIGPGLLYIVGDAAAGREDGGPAKRN